jgi:hypothetical protein
MGDQKRLYRGGGFGTRENWELHQDCLSDDRDTEPMEAMRQSLVFYRSRIQKFRANREQTS